MAVPVLTGFSQKVVVGVADFAVSNNPDVILTTYSLGSCLGVTLYDPVARVGGLLHLMLPDSEIDRAKAAENPAMFVDTGIPALFRAAYELHADKYRVEVCVAGGAQIMDNSHFFNIGRRNWEALNVLFAQHGLKVRASDVGGLVNRTMNLNLETGEVTLKISGKPGETPL
ncbi:MAG: chemotaxis protein CheD [Limisphaerales bacterium]